MTSTQQRAALQRQIWQIANDVRGSVDGWCNYRDKLLSFDGREVEWKTLDEVALEFGRGKSKDRPRNDEKLYGGNGTFYPNRRYQERTTCYFKVQSNLQ